MLMKKTHLFLGLLTLSLFACYSPKPFEAESSDDSKKSDVSSIGKVFPLNGGQQTCNPSVSQDTVNYPASMLLLNFAKIDVKSSDKSFLKDQVEVHDRLTVVDTANNVKWFLMRNLSKGECEFQDPEWSTHADFIVALRGYDQVRLTYVDGTEGHPLDIVFIDYANGGKKKAVKLKKPADRNDWEIDSPLISPDGNFVVYNMKKSGSWEAYIQELSKTSEPIKIERTKDMISEPAQPHWFEFAGRLFVLWAEIPGIEMLNKNKLENASVQDGSVGRTVMREVRLFAGAPSDIAVEWVGENRVVATVPMIGGRSPDGKFLATGTNPAYLIKLP